MILEGDVIIVHFQTTTKRMLCKSIGVQDWPPPEYLDIGGFKFKRTRYSKLSDEEVIALPHIVRGAEYEAVT